MKVFYTSPQCSYSGGIVLVAANSEEEALKTAFRSGDLGFCEYDYDSGEDIAAYNSYYEWKPFTEVKGLTFDTDTPKVILSNYYAE